MFVLKYDSRIRPCIQKLLTELSSQFSSWNEFFAISKVQVLRHIFVIFESSD